MRTSRSPLSAVAKVNPRTPQGLLSQKGKEVDFVPMSQLSEQGRVETNGSRPLEEVSKGYTYFENGDVIVAKITPCMENGKAAFVDGLPTGIAFGSTEFHVLRPGPNTDGRYLFYMVWNPIFRREAEGSMTGSAGQKRVPAKFFDRFAIPLPYPDDPVRSLTEQKRISEILDKADAIRRNRQEAAREIQSLSDALFLDLVLSHSGEAGWETYGLEEVLFFQEGPGVRNWQFTDQGVKLLNVTNMVDGQLVLTNTGRHVSEEEAYGKYQHFLAEAGDLVMATSGVTWGKTAWVAEHHLPLCMNTSTIRFRPLDGRVTKRYMHAFLGSHIFSRQIDKLVTGSAQPNFGPSHLRQVSMPVPPPDVQKKFEAQVDRVSKLADRSRLSILDAESLFNSLVQHAFRGEL